MTAYSNSYILNRQLDVILSDDNDKVLLKDRTNGSLKLMGGREWSIINSYLEGYLERVFGSFKKEYIEQVIAKAIELKILITQDPSSLSNQTELKSENFIEKIKEKVKAITNEYIHLDLQGNFSLFKLFTLHLKPKNIFEKFQFKYVAIIYTILVSCLLVFYFISTNKVSEIFFRVVENVTLPITTFMIIVFFSSYFLTIFHELGHFIAYKSLGGKANIIGMGVKFLALPIMYVNTDSVYLWKKRWKRLLVTFGGCIVDATMGLIFIVFIKYFYQESPNLSFYGYMVLISIAIKLFFNLNFFVQGTDGYFIFSDLIKKNNFAKVVETDLARVFFAMKKRNFSEFLQFKRSTWFSVFYFSVGFIFKCISIFLMIWSFIFIAKMIF